MSKADEFSVLLIMLSKCFANFVSAFQNIFIIVKTLKLISLLVCQVSVYIGSDPELEAWLILQSTLRLNNYLETLSQTQYVPLLLLVS